MLKEFTPPTSSRFRPRIGPRSIGAFGATQRDPEVDTHRPESAYSRPTVFDRHQDSTGHFSMEKFILLSVLDYVGERVVSIGCGSGWLDRELVLHRSEALRQGKTTLRLLGVDTEESMIMQARGEMEALIGGNRTLLHCVDDGRLSYDYKVATLGESSFADLNLNRSVIESPAPDTFMAFMIFALWVQKRETAIEQIAEKSRRGSGSIRPTFLINAEEFPTHITRDKYVTPAFSRRVKELKTHEMHPDKIWAMFARYNFRMRSGPTLHEIGGPDDTMKDHIMRSAVLEYF